MKKTVFSQLSRSPMLLGVAMLVAFSVLAPLQTAQADTSAGATIINIVTVTYRSDGSTIDQTETASSSIEVNLVASDLTFTRPPLNGVLTGLTCYNSAVASGATASELYAIVATANGSDTYDLTFTPTADANANISSSSYTVFNYDGTVALAQDPTLSAGVIVGVKDDTTLYLPGGSMDEAGFAANDVVLVNGEVFLVDNVTEGGSAKTTSAAEVLAELVLKAYTPESIAGITVGGTGSAPLFLTNDPGIGAAVGELVYIEVEITASATSTNGTDGEVAFTLNDGAGNVTEIDCQVTFSPATLTVTKNVTGTPNPGSTLTYVVRVENNSAAPANLVEVVDKVPTYTTLYNSGTTFAEVYYNSVTLADATFDITNDEDADDSTRASGDANGFTPGGTMSFYLGDTNDGSAGTGGTMAAGDFATITYDVVID